MKINGQTLAEIVAGMEPVVDPSGVAVEAYDLKIVTGSRPITTATTWGSRPERAYFAAGRMGAKTAQITIPVKAGCDAAIQSAITAIVAACDERTLDIELEGRPHGFFGVLAKYDVREMVPDKWHNLVLHITGDEVGPFVRREISFEEQGEDGLYSATVTNPGNAPTPAGVATYYFLTPRTVTVDGLIRDPATLAPKSEKINIAGTGTTRTQIQHFADSTTGIDSIYYRYMDGWGAPSYKSDGEVYASDAFRYDAAATSRAWVDLLPSRYDPSIDYGSVEAYGLPILMPGESILTSTDPGRMRLWFRPVYV